MEVYSFEKDWEERIEREIFGDIDFLETMIAYSKKIGDQEMFRSYLEIYENLS